MALGTLVGAIPFGPLKFGPAGALFVGLALGALDPALGQGLGLVQAIGLGLFVYTIGLAAGASFFRDFSKQAFLMLGCVLLLAGYAGLVVAADALLGIHPAITVELHDDIAVHDVPGIAEVPGKIGGEVRISYMMRGGEMTVARPDQVLHRGDRVVLVGTSDGVHRAAQQIGQEADEHLLHDRRAVDFRHFVVSNPRTAGRTVSDLRIPARFDGSCEKHQPTRPKRFRIFLPVAESDAWSAKSCA
ncbi:MAG: TrkA C-terminal domain-containing protein [Propionibacteriaceae bacterium]|nr:TrkA C-terminal domain-containing protein [Propionibacteriaceae bacterium]